MGWLVKITYLCCRHFMYVKLTLSDLSGVSRLNRNRQADSAYVFKLHILMPLASGLIQMLRQQQNTSSRS